MIIITLDTMTVCAFLNNLLAVSGVSNLGTLQSSTTVWRGTCKCLRILRTHT